MIAEPAQAGSRALGTDFTPRPVQRGIRRAAFKLLPRMSGYETRDEPNDIR